MTTSNPNNEPSFTRKDDSLQSIAESAVLLTISKMMRDKEIVNRVEKYFTSRGINEQSIRRFTLGYYDDGKHHGFMIPIQDKDGRFAYMKLRRTPEDENAQPVAEALGRNGEKPPEKYRVYPAGSKLLLVGEDELLTSRSNKVLIVEGELDRIKAIQDGVKIPVVTGGSAQVFKNEWIDSLKNMRHIWICFDNDEPGIKGAKNLAERIIKRIPTASVYIITLPFGKDTGADLSDYFNQNKGTADELFTKYTEWYGGARPIDPDRFKEMTVSDVAKILDLTIKDNFANKVIIFLAMLLAYTEDSQLNIMLNAQSSTGKTYLVNEVSRLFPPQDIHVYGKTSPTALYYNEKLKKHDEKTGKDYIDLERSIIIFSEQQNMQLLENLRAFLSHDSKDTPFILTNKGKNGKNTATEAYLRGFSSTFFCSANLRIDEQEETRSFILSPESSEETVKAGVDICITKNTNKKLYYALLDNHPDRRLLMDRILYVKSLKVDQINIGDNQYLKKRFYENLRAIPPKTQRKIDHFISLVKGIALLNAPFRMVDGNIVTTKSDVDEAMKLWSAISESMFYGIPPQVLDFYKKRILPAYHSVNETRGKKKGITYDQLAMECYKQTGSYPNLDVVRKMFIPTLQCASLISYEKDDDDKRQMLITPLIFPDDSVDKKAEK